MTFLAPSSATRLPAASPATDSSWPKYISAPRLCQSASPALNITTGMPAAFAFLSAPLTAPGLGIVTAMPSTFLSIAAWMSLRLLRRVAAVGVLELTLSLPAAASAPLRMMSKKVSPAGRG